MNAPARVSSTVGELLRIDGAFPLACGATIERLHIAYETWGELDAAGGNAVYVCHALTGSAHASSWAGGAEAGWWDGLIGPGLALDPRRHFIVCANLLGSCYGTTGPASLDPETGEPYGPRFPVVTTRDMVRAQKLLLSHLGVRRLQLVIGGSLGGMLTWQWLVDEPDFVGAAVAIAGTAQGSPWLIALNQVARQAIFNDPAWNGGRYRDGGPQSGLALARMIAMISYRSERQFWQRFGRAAVGAEPHPVATAPRQFQVESYLHHHGDKLVRRFDARSYVSLTRAMDLHDVASRHGGLEEALGRVRAPVLAVGIDSDVLFPRREVRSAVSLLERLGKRAEYAEIHSISGHDAFLIEYDQLNRVVGSFLDRVYGRSACVC